MMGCVLCSLLSHINILLREMYDSKCVSIIIDALRYYDLIFYIHQSDHHYSIYNSEGALRDLLRITVSNYI